MKSNTSNTHQVKPRKLTGYQTPKFMRDLLSRLEDRGFENPILYGGALRDSYIGAAIRDYDVLANLGTVADCTMPEVERIRAVAKEVIAMGGRQFDFDERLSQCTGDLAFAFNFKGKSIDLHIPSCNQTVGIKMNSINAPIDNVAMDSGGTVYVHQEFEEHANRKWFVPQNVQNHPVKDYKRRMERRFERLRSKIHGLWMPAFNI